MANLKLPYTFIVDYLSLQTFLIFGLVFLIVYKLFNRSPVIKLPPGPSTLPFIGNIHQLGGGQMHVVTAKMAAEFGSIMTLNFAGMKAVLLADLKAIKEAFLEKGDCFADRFQHQVTEYMHGTKGGYSLYDNNIKDDLKLLSTLPFLNQQFRRNSFRPQRTVAELILTDPLLELASGSLNLVFLEVNHISLKVHAPLVPIEGLRIGMFSFLLKIASRTLRGISSSSLQRTLMLLP